MMLASKQSYETWSTSAKRSPALTFDDNITSWIAVYEYLGVCRLGCFGGWDKLAHIQIEPDIRHIHCDETKLPCFIYLMKSRVFPPRVS